MMGIMIAVGGFAVIFVSYVLAAYVEFVMKRRVGFAIMISGHFLALVIFVIGLVTSF